MINFPDASQKESQIEKEFKKFYPFQASSKESFQEKVGQTAGPQDHAEEESSSEKHRRCNQAQTQIEDNQEDDYSQIRARCKGPNSGQEPGRL